jgi:hypothetical protein
MRWAVYVARMYEKKNAYKLLMGKPDGKKPCTYLREIKCSGVD